MTGPVDGSGPSGPPDRAAGVDAVVLRLVDHGERARIVTLFTADDGRVAVMARGARGNTKRFGGMDLFQRGQAGLVASRRPGGMATLKAFTATERFGGIRDDIVRFATASFFVELVLVTTAAGDAVPEQFTLLGDSLARLSDADGVTDLLLGFQLRWFETMGELPELSEEGLAVAGLPHLEDPDLAVARALRAGVGIGDLTTERFTGVGALTRAIRNRVATRPLESIGFLHQVLAA